MYAVIVFALVLLSPMPFVSPFGHIIQDVAAQSPFGPFEPTTSPSLISGQNAQIFELKSELVHSPAGYFGITAPHFMETTIIDNHTYVLTTYNGANVDIRNITNIESPTRVSTIPNYNAKAVYLDTVVIDNSTHVLGLGSGQLVSITNINDVENPVSSFFPVLKTSSNADPQVVETVLINETTYALVGAYAGGIYVMNITSPNNITLLHYIEDSGDFEKLSRIYADLVTFTVEESVYVLAADAGHFSSTHGITIINITTPSSPSLAYSDRFNLNSTYFTDIVTIDESIYALITNIYSSSIPS